MSFPQTSHTLIQRISTGGEDRDWRQFLDDYWGLRGPQKAPT
jgi:hypothetical protein